MILRTFSKNFLAIQTKLSQGVKYLKEGTFNALPITVFNCINNTQNYSQFIPWCSKSLIVKTVSPVQNFTELTITFQKVKSLSYLSHVQIFGQNNADPTYKVQSICRDQPLKSLVSIWQIEKNSIIKGEFEQTFVKYSIEYEFASPILQLTSHFFLDYVGQSMWIIFKDQTEKIQKQISLNKENSQRITNEDKIVITFGKINIMENGKQKQGFQTISQFQQRKEKNLAQYLDKNPNIHKIYCKNNEFKRKLDNWCKLLDGTKDFEQKLQFKIKNYFIHRS